MSSRRYEDVYILISKVVCHKWERHTIHESKKIFNIKSNFVRPVPGDLTKILSQIFLDNMT